MAIQTFVASTVLTAAQMNALQGNDYNQTVSTKTASYTLVAADKGTKIVMNAGATNTTITVNTSLFSAGDTLTILNTSTSGTCTITAGTATVATAGSLALGLNQGGTLYFTSAGVSVFQATGVTAGASTKIGQVVSTVLLTAFTTASTSYTDVTGLSVAITPTLATSKVLVTVTLQGSQASTGEGFFRLMRDSTAIGSGTSGSVENGFAMTANAYYLQFFSGAFTFLDSPGTTSATTYKVQASTDSSGTIVVNRRGLDTAFGGSSTITVSEVIV